MSLTVTSHVARDLLQSAALFRYPHQVIWEYVSNGLDYVDPGVTPRAEVTITPQKITIVDNGRGMDRADLARFFTMHAENKDRREGRPGRGMFGTGKSAAFSIADTLRITSVKAGVRNVVELRRPDLEAATSGLPVPVRELETGQPCSGRNGTTVEISGLKKGLKPNADEIRRELERHLKTFRNAVLILDGQRVEVNQPPIERSATFAAEATSLSGAVLTLNVAKRPLDPHERGVEIRADDVLHEVTLAGSENREFANYIFGEVDIPALSTPTNGIDAFDMSRSGTLNRQNLVVIDALAFIGRSIEELRCELVEANKARKKQEETKRLQTQADEIAKLINQDYADFSQRFRPVRTRQAGAADPGRRQAENAEGSHTAFLEGGATPAIAVDGDQPTPRDDTPITPDPHEDQIKPPVEPAPPETDATSTGDDQPAAPRPARSAGGFAVRYDNNGVDETRCLYEAATRTLIINLDHPQVAAAKGSGGNDQPNFIRLSYEIAFTEYAIAFVAESALVGQYLDYTAPLTDVRERIDSLSRSAASIFADV